MFETNTKNGTPRTSKTFSQNSLLLTAGKPQLTKTKVGESFQITLRTVGLQKNLLHSLV